MRTVSIFKNGNNRAIRLPRDLDFEGGERARDHPGRGQHRSCAPSGQPGAHSWNTKKPIQILWRSARMLSATKGDLTCEQDLYA